MGDGYGPIVVSRDPRPASSLHECLLAVPGLQTSAYMALCIYLYPRKPTVKVVRFDEIPERVLSREVDAGLLIHEGQITYQDAGMYLIEDLGQWWTRETSLPLPLGVNAIRRELPGVDKSKLARLLRESVTYSLTHREQALEYALSFSHGLEAEKAIRFIEMYVNDLTLDLRERGRSAIELFLNRGSVQLQNKTPLVLDFVEY